MGFFDRFRRRSAGGPAAVRARLEGAMAKRRLRGWNPPLENINALVASGGPRLLARSRELVVTNGYAANACEAFAANLVGDGIKPSSLIGDADLRDRVQQLWLAWTDEADADGLTDFYGLQAMVAREMFVAGECFVRMRPRRVEDGLLVPLQLQLLQSEMLPFEKTETAANGNRIRCGIEFDGIGRRVAYHFRRRHPGDSTDQGAVIPETVRVPAADVLHIYRPIDAGQIRGLPHIAPAMVRLFLLDQYDDAELDRKKTAAMFAGFITKTAPEEPLMGEAEADLDGAAIASLEPGTMQVLLPGEDVKFSSPADVGGGYEAFQYRTLLAVSASLGLPYHLVTGDVRQANYSSLRAELVEFRRRIGQLQHGVIVHQLCRAVWMRWLETAVLSGALDADPATARPVQWIPPRWDYRDLLADVRSILGSGTRIGYAADWSEYFGHQPGDGSGDVFFHLDPLWADPEIDFVGIDNYMPLSDWRDGFEHADAAEGWPAIYDRAYLQGNIAGGEGFDWFYASAADRTAQVRTAISDGAASKPWVFRYKDLRAWWSIAHFDRPGGVESATPTDWAPQSKPIWFTELGCPAIDRGTNQPNVFFDPKSSESFTPHFSRGWRDDAIQRAYLEATYLWWGEAANNPLSSVYGGRMVHVPECAAWTWDARPYPFFPALTGVWTDGANWRLGHWLTGRLGAVSLAALVRHLCLRAGLPEARVDVTGLWGAVEGYAITALESPRASITTLSRHFGFDAVETGGVIRFVMRGRASVATLAPDDLVAPREGDVLELTRGQETELPQALKWQVARADEDYDAALVEARRITVDTTRIASESFPMAVPPEEAERRCRRALMEAWVGRETAAFRLPPSRLALDPADAIRLEHDGRLVDLRLVSIADAEARGIEAVRQDRATYDLPPGDPRAASLTRAVVFGAPDAVLMDLPQLTEDQPAHRPFAAAHAVPWPGEMAVFRSPSTDGFELLTTFGSRALVGALVSDFFAGPTSRFDLGNALVVNLLTGTLESVTDLTLFGGANALAIESAPGVWEIVQAGAAELLAPGRYRLTRLLRGQRGTEDAMGNPAPAGARVVVLDDSLATLPIAEADLGLPWNWRIGPASRPVSDETYVAQSFTPDGVGLRPFSVAHVEQPWRTPRMPGDLTIGWTRRSRALAADSWGGLEVPLAEELEAYEVEILDGVTVKRVLSTSTASAIYTAAEQISDWGAPLGPGDTLDIRIFQLSALVGRGAPKTVTLQL